MAGRSRRLGAESLDNSEEDDESNIGYDISDIDNSLASARGNQRIPGQSNISPQAAHGPQNDVEFHGAWVKAVSSQGDAFYVETSSSPNGRAGPSRSHHGAGVEMAPNSRGHKLASADGNWVAEERDANIYPNTVKSGFPKKVTFSDTGVVKTFVLPLNFQQNNYARHGTWCEQLFGIVPGRFPPRGSGESWDKRIMIQGLLPRGAAAMAGIKIGDWLMALNDIDVDVDNFEDVLLMISSERKAKLTLKRVAMETPTPKPRARRRGRSRSGEEEEEEELLRLISGERLHEAPASLRDILHGAFYLRLDIRSDELTDKEDVLYHFPRLQENQLLDIRGAFITLAQLLIDVANHPAKNSSVVISNQLVHVSYRCLDNRIFLLCLPADRFSVLQLNCVMRDICRLLLVLYGSLECAFEQRENNSKLDHFFRLVFQRLLLAQESRSRSPKRREFLEPFMDALCGIRAVMMPEAVKVLIHNCLSEFEGADFADMGESYYNVQRSYSILGSCLYYKGYLLANHLRKEDAVDLNLYLRYHGLLSLSSEEELNHLTAWREIFPTSRCHRQPTPSAPGYVEPDGRWFLLVVGMRNAVLGVVLEAGGCAEKAEGHPTPDPFYVNQANATLVQLEALEVFGLCELRLEGPPMPTLSSVDWFISTKGEKGRKASSPSATAFVQPPKIKKVKPASILKRKSLISSSGSLTHLNRQERYAYRDSMEKFSSESDLRLSGGYPEDVYLSSDSSDGSDVIQDRMTSPSSAFSSEMLAAGSGSRLFKGPKQSHNLVSLYDMSDLKRNVEEVCAAEEGSRVKLTTGYRNTLFHYVHFDSHEGIYVCPVQQEIRQVATATHSFLLKQFNLACLEIHRVFERSSAKASQEIDKTKRKFSTTDDGFPGKVKEYGMLFQCPLSDWSDSKKPPPSTSYWVVGRSLDLPVPSEFYVCFHDSAPQNVIEMAFKLMQGTLV